MMWLLEYEENSKVLIMDNKMAITCNEKPTKKQPKENVSSMCDMKIDSFRMQKDDQTAYSTSIHTIYGFAIVKSIE